VIALALSLAIALVPLKGLLVGVGLALALALPLINPVFGVYLAVLSVPVQELVALPGGLSLTQAAVLLAVVAWGAHLLAGFSRQKSRVSTTDDGRPTTLLSSVVGGWWSHKPSVDVSRAVLVAWLLLLWALLLATSLSPYSRAEGLKETARWGGAFLVWLIAVTTLRRRWQVYGLAACLLAAPAADALIGLAQFAQGDGPPTFRIAADLPYVRAYGTIGQPNSFAGYMNMAWPLALALSILDFRFRILDLLRRRDAGSVILHFAFCILLFLVAGLLLGALLASFSRGAWLGAGVGVLGMAAALLVLTIRSRETGDGRSGAGDRRREPGYRSRSSVVGRRSSVVGRRSSVVGRRSLVVVTMIAATVGAAQLLPAPISARLASIGRSVGIFDASAVAVTPENFAVVERMAHLQAGWRMLRAHPLVGVGPGNFTPAYPDFALAPWYASRGHAHNFYLHIAAEAGALGLLAYLALLGALIRQAALALRRASGTVPRGIAVGCCGIIAAVAGHNLFENLHVLNMGIQLAGVWALLPAIGRLNVER
jgi:hypothetical protein